MDCLIVRVIISKPIVVSKITILIECWFVRERESNCLTTKMSRLFCLFRSGLNLKSKEYSIS